MFSTLRTRFGIPGVAPRPRCSPRSTPPSRSTAISRACRSMTRRWAPCMRAPVRTRPAAWNCGPSKARRGGGARSLGSARGRARAAIAAGRGGGPHRAGGEKLDHQGRRNGARVESGRRAGAGAQARRGLRGGDPRLKEKGVPVAGADRLNIGEHIAVMDLVAAGRAALLPDDDLTLATALKSPLVGLTDDDLIRIAAYRGDDKSLRAALERHAADGDARRSRACEACSAGARWRASRPFRVLRLPARADAAGAATRGAAWAARRAMPSTRSCASRTNRRCRHALAHHLPRPLRIRRPHHQARSGLAEQRSAGDDGARRQGTRGADRVPDRRLRRARPRSPISSSCNGRGGGARSGRPARPSIPMRSPPRGRLRRKGAEEHNRLLYVAMTRAKDRLVVAPYLTSGKTAAGGLVGDDPATGSSRRRGPGTGRGALRTHRDLAAGAGRTAATAERPCAPLDPSAMPDWLSRPVAAEPEPLPPIRPSSALGAADRMTRPGDGPYAPEARLRGTIVHALLERLPALPPSTATAMARPTSRRGRRGLPQGCANVRQPCVERDRGCRPWRPCSAPARAPKRPSRAGRDARRRALRLGPDRPAGGARRSRFWWRISRRRRGRRAKASPPPQSYVTQLALYRLLLRGNLPGASRMRAFLVWTAGPGGRRNRREPELDAALALIKAA